jgi:DNA-binding NtrC family response regulator
VAVSTTILRNGEGGFSGAVAAFRDLTLIDGFRGQLKAGYASGGKVPAYHPLLAGKVPAYHPLLAGKVPAYHPLLAGMVSRNKHMQELFRILPDVARTDKAVLIEGENGTGKKLLALELHETSPRRGGPFVPVNCAALPGALAEAALFGYVKGAFPGAREEKAGTLASAESGSLFIEEVGSLPPPAQERLFKALKDGCFYPLGGSAPVEFRTRVIAAGSANLDALARKGTLREDLFRALSGIWLQLPPLRERREDVPLLVEHFLSKYNLTSGRNVNSVSPEAMRVLLAYSYPGNIRELEHIMEHAFVLCSGCTVLPEHLPAFLTSKRPLPEFKTSRDRKLKPLDVSEKEALIAALCEHDWNKQATARALGITRTTLWRKLKKYSIKTPPRHKRTRRG